MRYFFFFILLFTIITGGIFCLSLPVSAADNSTYILLEPGVVGGTPSVSYSSVGGGDEYGLIAYLKLFFRYLLYFLIIAAVVILIKAGIEYSVSENFQTKGKARNQIKNALGGLVLVLCSWLILYTINPDILSWKISITQTPKLMGPGGEDLGTGEMYPPLKPGESLVPGKRYEGVKATAYSPIDTALEGGKLDSHGNKLYTLQDYLEGKAPYVSVAMDKNSYQYGQDIWIPELDRAYNNGKQIPFKVVDNGGHFNGKTGTSAIDICTRPDAMNDSRVNKPLTVLVLNAPNK